MPTTIIIGTEGSQWFPIKQTKVSRKHAILTIPDNENEPWILEDNHSTNGTFIRDENGKLRRISKAQISALTYIQLGPPDREGCSFYATRCLLENKTNPSRFNKEFTYIRDELNEYKKLLNKGKKRNQLRRYVNRYSWIAIYFLMIVFEATFPIEEIFPDVNGQDVFRFLKYGLRNLPILIIGIIQWWFNRKSKLGMAKERMRAISECPNPKCKHRLNKEEEIPLGQCNECNAHI